MAAYLFVHFRETRTPDGEQVYFGVSEDGFNWEAVNGGDPVLWSYQGDKGVRDCTITRTDDGRFVIMGTDLSLAYGMVNQYDGSWEEITRNGSDALTLWESADLVAWSEQRMVELGDGQFGCLWAPDITYDRENGDYVVHWSSSHEDDDYAEMALYYARTEDFESFSDPELLYRNPDGGVIDSAMYEEDGTYYCFAKSQSNPTGIVLLESERPTGPFTRVPAFDRTMAGLDGARYEAPTAFRLDDGRWCLFLDYFGGDPETQGYVPFVADSLDSAFERADDEFSFPYGFKHGTVLRITREEYERLRAYEKDPGER
ncbi:glycoside hydrolase family 43 protein [Halarchaeum sp. CBA1220]|uniref:glycoside hydrolase family 43 protein n=1 Tax=Halarchaeum sp. CBA1220 TaxID=1853682 RepID=UPI000F3AA1D4|nr:glycoside hydrolase family 43 protein [Halarchaeum sp. CBA1220]QLC33179.1 glycoside hydrolase family 43 protein [Halarchaeum sp. CBA1220]